MNFLIKYFFIIIYLKLECIIAVTFFYKKSFSILETDKSSFQKVIKVEIKSIGFKNIVNITIYPTIVKDLVEINFELTKEVIFEVKKI